MKNVLFLLVVACGLSSCATILNSKYCKTDFRSTTPMSAIIDSTTIELRPYQANVVAIARDTAPKEVVLVKDTVKDTIELYPHLSTAYFFNVSSCGLGFLVDKFTIRRWKYPSCIELINQDIKVYGKKKESPITPIKIARLNFHVSLPYVNAFYLSYGNIKRQDAGFGGLTLGLSYYLKRDKMFMNLSATGIMSYFFPFPVPMLRGGMLDREYSIYGSLTNNHMLAKKRLSIGYGISYGRDIWNTVNSGRWHDDATEEEVKQKSIYRHTNSLGFVLPVYYYTKHSFYFGVVYRSMFLQFTGKTRFTYQHTVSLDFGWRIRLKK